MDNKLIKGFMKKWIKDNKQCFHDIIDFIWENPELGLEEYEACEKLTSILTKYGFSVENGLEGMPTAFIATYGNKGPVVGFNTEYDCLPGLSQDANCFTKTSLTLGTPEHGCGHNLLGTTEILADIALRYALEEYKIEAIIKIFGSPTEEQCLGKPFMGRAGLYDNVDFFLD